MNQISNRMESNTLKNVTYGVSPWIESDYVTAKCNNRYFIFDRNLWGSISMGFAALTALH